MAKLLEKADPLTVPEQKMMIDQILADNKDLPGAMMVVLNELQTSLGYIPLTVQAYIADKLRVPLSEINGVVSFYSFFTTVPRGRHIAKFCMGTACYVSGSPELIDKAKETLKVELDETTEDGLMTIELCRCIGACSQAPAVVVDKDVHGRVHTNNLPQILQKYK